MEMSKLLAACVAFGVFLAVLAAKPFDGQTVVVLIPTEMTNFFKEKAAEFQDQFGGTVITRILPIGELADTTVRETRGGSEFYDVYTVQSPFMLDFVSGLQDLTDMIRSDEYLQWEDMFAVVRETQATFQSRAWCIPIDQDMMMLHYREDVRTRLGLPVPETWEDVISFAEAAHGQDMNDDGTPDFGFCVPTSPRSFHKFNFVTVFASIIQTLGTNQGMYFDKQSMHTLFDSEAGRYAAEIWARLSKYGAAQPDDTYNQEDPLNHRCTVSNNASSDCAFWKTIPRQGSEAPSTKFELWPWLWLSMAGGRCALSVDWSAMSSVRYNPPPGILSYAQTRLRSTFVGSDKVLDVSDRQRLATCTAELCPYGFQSQRTGKWVNKAPFLAGGGMALTMNSKTKSKDMAFRFMSYCSVTAIKDITSFASWIQAFRSSQLKDRASYLAAGIDETSLTNFLDACDHALSHRNAAMDFRIPKATSFLNAIDDALVAMLSSLSSYTDAELKAAAATWAAQVSAKFDAVVADVGIAAARTGYRVSLNDKVVTETELAKCTSGTYFSDLVFRCVDCELGRFSDTGGQRLCQLCPVGRFQNSTGATACRGCSLGRYSSETGRSQTCAPCVAGRYSGQEGSDACSPCSVGTFSASDSASVCFSCGDGKVKFDDWTTLREVTITDGSKEWGYFEGSNSEADCRCNRGNREEGGRCFPCGEGLSCIDGREVIVQRGYYKSDASGRVFQCSELAFCPGGAVDTCAEGRTGLACSECEAGKTPAGDGRCTPCSEADVVPFVFLLLAFPVVMVVFYLWSAATRQWQSSSTEYLLASIAGILLLFQTMGVFSRASVMWPEPLRSMLAWGKFLNFDIDSIARLGCVSSLTPAARFAAKLVLLPGCCAVLTLVHVVYCLLRYRGEIRARFRVVVAALGMAAMSLFVGISGLVLAPFQCKRHPSGDWTMLEYSGVLCWRPGPHTAIVVMGCVALCIPVGFLSLVLFLLRILPHKLCSGDAEFLTTYGFLFNRVRLDYSWVIFFTLVRNLFVAFVPSMPSSFWQLFSLASAFMLSAGITTRFLPWKIMNGLDVGGNVLMIGIVFVATSFVDHTDVTGLPQFGAVVLVTAAVSLGLLLCLGVVRKFRPRRRTYDLFLCHQKASASACARLLKMLLHYPPQFGMCVTIFLDADDLRDLDNLFQIVREDVQLLLALCSCEIFQSSWCLGELTTALMSNVPVLPLYFPDFTPPADLFIQGIVATSVMVENGIRVAEVQSSLVLFRSLEYVEMPQVLDSASVSTVVQQIAGRVLQPKSSNRLGNRLWMRLCRSTATPAVRASAGNASDQSRPACDIVIMTDCSNLEACASAKILHLLLHSLAMAASMTPPRLDTLEGDVLEDSSTQVVVLCCWPGCFASSCFLLGLFRLIIYRVESVATVVCTDGFQFPCPSFYASLEQHVQSLGLQAGTNITQTILHSLVSRIFRKISHRLSIGGNADVLQVEVERIWKSVRAPTIAKLESASTPQSDVDMIQALLARAAQPASCATPAGTAGKATV